MAITVKIDESIANKLSNLLVKQKIRTDLLVTVMDDPEKYNKVEDGLVEIIKEIDSVKQYITDHFIPEEYQTDYYQWTYPGIGNTIEINHV